MSKHAYLSRIEAVERKIAEALAPTDLLVLEVPDGTDPEPYIEQAARAKGRSPDSFELVVIIRRFAPPPAAVPMSATGLN